MSYSAPATAYGFTLIESLISVALLAILMGIALPSLEQHWQQARRQNAQNALQQLHLRQTQWRGLHADYASSLSDLAWPTLTSASPYYTFTAQQATAQSFELHATAQGLQTRDTPCLHMSLLLMPDGSVRRTSNQSKDSDPGRCWPW
jgi:type IV pilus assembly protein PilE